MRSERLRSAARKLLIVLLLASAVLLCTQTDYFSASGGRQAAASSGAGERMAAATSASADAATMCLPRAVLVHQTDGSESASAWDGETTEVCFRRFAAVLGEALGSASAPETITEEDFRAGMEGGCVFLDLGADYPLGLLSDWLGAGGGGAAEMTADALYLGLTGEEVRLCFRAAEGGFFRCATATQADTLRSRMRDFREGSARFAWEDGLLQGADPYAVIPERMPEIRAVRGGSAAGAVRPELLMELLGMNAYVATSYYDADGTQVLMDGGRTLRISPDGALSYRNAGSGGALSETDLVGTVNQICHLVRRGAGFSAEDAQLVFSGVERGDSYCTVYLDYAVNGIPVLQPEGHAAAVTASGGAVRWATILLREYTIMEQRETVLPFYRAAAVAAARGETPKLVYTDSGEHTRCVWVYETWRQKSWSA